MNVLIIFAIRYIQSTREKCKGLTLRIVVNYILSLEYKSPILDAIKAGVSTEQNI